MKSIQPALKIKLLAPHCINGTEYPTGSIVNLPKDAADGLLETKAAEAVTEAKKSIGEK